MLLFFRILHWLGVIIVAYAILTVAGGMLLFPPDGSEFSGLWIVVAFSPIFGIFNISDELSLSPTILFLIPAISFTFVIILWLIIRKTITTFSFFSGLALFLIILLGSFYGIYIAFRGPQQLTVGQLHKFAKTAADLNNPSICMNKINEKHQNEQEMEMGCILRMAMLTGQYELCKTIKDFTITEYSPTKERCKTRLYEIYRLSQSDLCFNKKIYNADCAYEYCSTNFLFTSSFDDCFSTQARNTSNKKWCDLITNDDKKIDCLNKLTNK